MPTKQYAAKITIGGALEATFKNSFGGASAAIQALGKEVRALSRHRSDIRAFGESSKKIEELRRKLQDAKLEAKRAGEALASAAKPTARLMREADTAARKVKGLEQSIEEQVGTLGKLTFKLNQAGIKTADLARHDAKLEQRIKSVTSAMQAQETAADNFSEAKSSLGNWMMAGVTVGAAVAAWKPPLQAAAEFSDAMIDVGKFVDGADTPGKLKEIGSAIRDIGRKSPLGAGGIAAIVAEGGKIGMAAQEALDFAKATEVMAIGLEMTADESKETITKIKTGMGSSVKEVLNLGDAINFLADKTAAGSKNVAEIMMRQGGTVKATTKLASEQIAALAAAFDPVSPNAEIAATAMKNFTKALTIGSAASDPQIAAFGKIGMIPEEVADAMQKDGVGTIMRVLEAVKAVPDAERGAVLTKLFGDESKGAIAQLLNNTGQVAAAFALVADKQNYLGRSQQEYEREMQKSSNRWAVMKSSLNDVGITIGLAVLPAVQKLGEAIAGTATKVSLWAEKNPEVANKLIVGAAAATALAAAVVGVGIAIKYGAVAWGAFGLVTAKIGVVAAAAGLPVIGLVGIFVAVGAVIVGVGLMIRKYWEPISIFFTGLWDGIKDGWNKAGGPELWGEVMTKVNKAGKAFQDFIRPVSLTMSEMKEAHGTGKALGEWLAGGLANNLRIVLHPIKSFEKAWEGVKIVVGDCMDYMAERAERFFRMFNLELPQIGGAVDSLKSKLGIPSSGRGVPGTAIAPVRGGAGGIGNAIKAKKAESVPLPEMKGKETSQNINFQIHAAPGQSEEGIARAVARILKQEAARERRSSMWDGGSFAMG